MSSSIASACSFMQALRYTKDMATKLLVGIFVFSDINLPWKCLYIRSVTVALIRWAELTARTFISLAQDFYCIVCTLINRFKNPKMYMESHPGRPGHTRF